MSQVLERILAVDYHFPASIPVSEACKDLLRHILVADPAKRYSIQDIQKHPWCAPAAHLSSSNLALNGMPPLQSRSDWPHEACVLNLLARSWEVCTYLSGDLESELCGSSHGSINGDIVQGHGTEAAVRTPTILLHPHKGVTGGHNMEESGVPEAEGPSWRAIGQCRVAIERLKTSVALVQVHKGPASGRDTDE